MKVTVAIPTYNNLKDLKRALDSVFMQDYDDYEIVITDDSKNNETEEYINGLNHPKIRYFHNIPSLGPSANWNSMIEKSKGEYVKILFQDDWFMTKDALRKMVEMMDKHPEADFGYCRQIGFKRGTNKVVHRRAQKYVKRLKKDPAELIFANRISAPSVVILKQTKNYRFDPLIMWGNDSDFYIQAITDNPNFAFLNKELIALGCSETQLTRSCENSIDVVLNSACYLYNKHKDIIQTSKYRKKIETKIINSLKNYNVQNLEELKSILTYAEVPDFVVEYYTAPPKVKKTLVAEIRSWFDFLIGGGATQPGKIRFYQHHCFGSDVL